MKSTLKKQPVQTGTLRQLIIGSNEFIRLLKDFEQWLRVFGFAESTVYYSPVYVRSFFYFLEGKGITHLSEISNNYIVAYIHELESRKNFRTGRKLSDNYLLNHLNAIKLFARHVLESRGLLIDSSYRYSKGQLSHPKWISRKEIERLYYTCDQGPSVDMNRAILSVYYGLGLRRMEGVGLDISDIQKKNGLVFVKHAKFKQVRFVPFNQRILADLERYEQRYRKIILRKAGRKNEKALLVSERGRRICGNAVYSRLQSLAEKAGLGTPLSIHSLRHSLATHLMENGLDLENIASFLGHKSLESKQIFTHLAQQKN